MQNYDALKRYMEKSDSSVYMGKHTDYKRRTHLTVLFGKTEIYRKVNTSNSFKDKGL